MELKAIHYAKPCLVDLEELQKQNEESEYNPFEISELQFYNPLYQRFFEMNENNYQKIALNQSLSHSRFTTRRTFRNKGNLGKTGFCEIFTFIRPISIHDWKIQVGRQ